jgi:hypothetical protein
MQREGGDQVHAVLVEVSISDFDQARKELDESVVPMVSKAPGFVSGVWVARTQAKGRAIVVFESEEAAKAAAEQVRATARVGVTIDSVDVGEVVARA